MRTATLTIQLDTSDAALSADDAAALLARIVDLVNDEAYVSASALHDDSDEEQRFWSMSAEAEDGHAQPYGDDTMMIVDEQEGGVIAYAHRLNDQRILNALRAVS